MRVPRMERKTNVKQKINTGIKGDEGGIKLFWTRGEKRTWNGE